ncbi:expressed unknown protein [Ectocarpus siliculosus]|uniref:Uncharacterized protein n=1 Tax=Ectocarpus siliculosus TaxID=2880 RepID=D7FPD9_ECTSI|nr:expressed unknown protein [Ectocarpus siliculosus]|eukprot:CBJ30397.1 expressed unknown protein [Ectocarpus siliculosus]
MCTCHPPCGGGSGNVHRRGGGWRGFLRVFGVGRNAGGMSRQWPRPTRFCCNWSADWLGRLPTAVASPDLVRGDGERSAEGCLPLRSGGRGATGGVCGLFLKYWHLLCPPAVVGPRVEVVQPCA